MKHYFPLTIFLVLALNPGAIKAGCTPERAVITGTYGDYCNRNDESESFTLFFEDEGGDGTLSCWDDYAVNCSPSQLVSSSMPTLGIINIAIRSGYTGPLTFKICGRRDKPLGGWEFGPWSNEVTINVRGPGEQITAQFEGPGTVLEGKAYRYNMARENFTGHYIRVIKGPNYVGNEYLNQFDANQNVYFNNIDFPEEYEGDITFRVYGNYVCGQTANYSSKAIHVIPIPNTPAETAGRTYFRAGETARFSINNYDSNSEYYWDIQPASLVTKNQNSNGTCDVTFNNTNFTVFSIKVRAVLNGETGSYSPMLECRSAAAPTIPVIEGPGSVCYSEYKNQFLYHAESEFAVTWSVSGTGATIQPDGKSATVTINGSTSQFQVRAKASNGFIETSWGTKNVNVTSGQVDIDFGDLDPCSGQGNIHLTGIEPSGGIYWVHGRENISTFYATHYLYQYNSDPVSSVSQGAWYFGNYYSGWYENILNFNLSSIPSTADIISAKLVMHISTGSLQDVRGSFGKLNSPISSGTGNSVYENAKGTGYDIDVYEINENPSVFELDVTEFVIDWIHGDNYGIYLDPLTNPDNVLFYTHLASISNQRPKLEVIYSLDNSINTNIPGSNYQITYKLNQGACYSQESTTVTVLRTPNVTFNAPEFCSDEIPENLSGGNSDMTGNGQYLGNDVNNNIFYSDIPGSHDVTYRFTATNGCTSESTDQVIIRAQPDFDILSVDAICGGNQIIASIPNGSSYPEIIWNVDGQEIRNVTSVSFTPPASFSGYKHIEVDVTDSYGCSNIIQKDIEIFETPELTLNDRTECRGAFLQYYPDHVDISEGNLSYQWSTGATTDHINILVQNPQSYFLTVTSDNSCSATDQMNILVLDLPQVTVDNDVICFGESTTLSAVPFMTQWDYNWDIGYSGNEITIIPDEAGSNNYTVWVTDENGCMNSYTTEVYVNELPEFTLSDADACLGVPVSISAPPGYRNYIWSTGATGTSVISITPFASQTISCTVEDYNGCRNTESMQLTVHTPETFSLEALNDELFCFGYTATLTGPDGYEEYHW